MVLQKKTAHGDRSQGDIMTDILKQHETPKIPSASA
jgi:predicted transcriptional regulator